MTADDVVTASLAALEREEVVCIPALAEQAMFGELSETQIKVFRAKRDAAHACGALSINLCALSEGTLVPLSTINVAYWHIAAFAALHKSGRYGVYSGLSGPVRARL